MRRINRTIVGIAVSIALMGGGLTGTANARTLPATTNCTWQDDKPGNVLKGPLDIQFTVNCTKVNTPTWRFLGSRICMENGLCSPTLTPGGPRIWTVRKLSLGRHTATLQTHWCAVQCDGSCADMGWMTDATAIYLIIRK